MNDQPQKILDSAHAHMQEAQQREHSALPATRVLHALIVALSRSLLTEEQQNQLEAILELHEDCIRHNGQAKA